MHTFLDFEAGALHQPFDIWAGGITNPLTVIEQLTWKVRVLKL